MDIGIDIRALDSKNITGVDTYLRALLNHWLTANSGHKFILFGTKRLVENEIVKKYIKSGHSFVPQPYKNKIFNFCLSLLNKPHLDTILDHKIDVYFLPNPIFWSFSKNIPVVATFHDLANERLSGTYSTKRLLWHLFVNMKSLAKRANIVIAVSESTKNDLIKLYGINSEKINVIKLGVDEIYFSSENSVKTKTKPRNILFLGSVEPRKNAFAILQAFDILSKKFPDLNLILAGGFSPQKDNRSIKKIKDNPKIILTGFVSEEEKISLYNNAEVLVLPSFYEGFGLQILEAFAIGVPVITSVGSSMPEVSSNAAILVNPYNSSDIALAIGNLLTDINFRDSLISRGKDIAHKFRWENTAKDTLKLIEQVCKK